MKFDGYRVKAHTVGSNVQLYSRNGHDITDRFPSIAQLHDLPAKAAVLDGEVVASDADGRPNFARLHVRWTRPHTVHLWAFGLLAFNGRELWPQALVKRQAYLHALLERFGSLSEPFGDGRALLCLSVIKAKIQRDGPFTTKGGIVRRRLGRPDAEPKQIERARQVAKGVGIGKVARLTGLGTGTVHKLKREMAAFM